MSYERLAAVVGPPAQPKSISFYYVVDDVFNDSSLRSMYQARNIKDQSGVSMVDDYAITEDERDIHLGLLEDAVFDVFLHLLKYTKSLTDSIYHNQDYTPSGGVLAKTSGVKIVDNEAYNENYIKAIDMNLLKAIRFYILRDWFNTQGQDVNAQKFDALYLIALRNMEKYAFQLKKVSLS
jgi:hypothetical protein